MSKTDNGMLTNQVDAEPNHMILWLDATIGNPQQYIHLKKAFGSNTDPCAETFVMLSDRDYDELLVMEHAVSVRFEGVVFLLQAFTDIDACIQAFEDNKNKRIFFITSGALGRHAVPQIIEKYRRIFTDLITDKPYPSIYVYCHNIEYQMDWIMDHYEYIQAFNFDADLLERLTRDIAEYFIERSQRLKQDNYLKNGLHHLGWAKRLWHQYDKMQQGIVTDEVQPVRLTQRMREIDQLFETMEANLSPKLPEKKNEDNDEGADSDDDTKGGQACD